MSYKDHEAYSVGYERGLLDMVSWINKQSDQPGVDRIWIAREVALRLIDEELHRAGLPKAAIAEPPIGIDPSVSDQCLNCGGRLVRFGKSGWLHERSGDYFSTCKRDEHLHGVEIVDWSKGAGDGVD